MSRTRRRWRPVGEQRQGLGAGVEDHLDADMAGGGLDVGDGIARQLAQLEGRAVEVERARLGAGHEEEVVDHAVQAAGVAQDDRPVGGGLLRRGRAGGELLGEPDDGRQRGAQVVRDRREQLLARAPGRLHRLLALELVAHQAGEHLHEADVLAAELALRLAREAAERPVERAVVAAQGHAEVGADVGLLGDVEGGGDRVRARVGHRAREAAVDHALAVGGLELGAVVQREAEALGVAVGAADQLTALAELADEGELHAGELARGLQGALDHDLGGRGGDISPPHRQGAAGPEGAQPTITRSRPAALAR